jgi:tRNA threonylcarbamoyladenosine biosynthesis protein TsaB
MNILGIETSSRVASVAVACGDRIFEVTGPSDAQHSVSLIDDCRKAAEKAGIRIRDFDRIAVGLGPGSFTGIRLGCTAAKSLAWVLDVPAGGVSTFQALAARVVSETDTDGRTVYIIGDARKNELFAGEYRSSEEGVIEDFLGVVRLEEAARFFRQGSIVAGPGIRTVKETLVGVEWADIKAPTASFVISETIRTSVFKPAVESEIEPLYLKPAYVNIR